MRAQQEVGFIEKFATASDRRAVLKELIPGQKITTTITVCTSKMKSNWLRPKPHWINGRPSLARRLRFRACKLGSTC